MCTTFHQLISFALALRDISRSKTPSLFTPRIRIKPFDGALNFPRKTHSFQSMHEHSVSRLDIHYQIDAVLSSVTSSCTPTPMPALQRHSIKNRPSDSIKSRAVFIHSFPLRPSFATKEKEGSDTINKIHDNLIREKITYGVNFHAFARERDKNEDMCVLLF